MKLLNFGIYAALAVSALALAQPDRGQNNKVPAKRMKVRKVPVSHSRNGRTNNPGKVRKVPVPKVKKVRRNGPGINRFKKVNQRKRAVKKPVVQKKAVRKPALQKPRRFRKGERKQYKARRSNLKSIPAQLRKQKRRSRTNGNQATDDGYYYDQQYWYYPDYDTTGATPTYPDPNYVTEGPIYPTEQDGGSEDCAPLDPTVRVGFWDDVATVTNTLPELSANDIEGIQKEAMTKTYEQTGRFLMEDGGTASYEVKSHSLIVQEICPGQGSGQGSYYTSEDYYGAGRKKPTGRRRDGQAKRKMRRRNVKPGNGNKQG